MLRPTFASHEPSVEVARITTWLRASVPASPTLLQKVPDPPLAKIEFAGRIETPLQFGAQNNLFGMLCQAGDCTKTGLAVVIGNSSGSPHCAPVTVELARLLVAADIDAFRIDFAGLGDSVAVDDAETYVLKPTGEGFFSRNRCARTTWLSRYRPTRPVFWRLPRIPCSASRSARLRSPVDKYAIISVENWIPDLVQLQVKVHCPTTLFQNLGSKHSWKRLILGAIDLRRLLAGLSNWCAGQVGSASRTLQGALRLRQTAEGFVKDSMRCLSGRT